MIHPDDRERTRAAIERSVADRAGYDTIYRTVDAMHQPLVSFAAITAINALRLPITQLQQFRCLPELQFAALHSTQHFQSSSVPLAHRSQSLFPILIQDRPVCVSFQANANPVFTLIYLRDGRLLTSGVDGTAVLWKVHGGEVRRLATFVGHQGTVYFATVSPDNRTLATGAMDRTIRLWDISWLGNE